MAVATIKKTGTTDGKSNAPGGGGRFQQMTNSGMSGGLAAAIGRKVYGKKKFQKMATQGKEPASTPSTVATTTPPVMETQQPKGIAVGNLKKVLR